MLTGGRDGRGRAPWGEPAPIIAAECWCGQPSRGLVGPEGGVPAHICGDCSAEHCETAAYAAQCEFGVCSRAAELELVLSPPLAPVQVCGLHIAPVLDWGLPVPIEAPAIRYLRTRPESAA